MIAAFQVLVPLGFLLTSASGQDKWVWSGGRSGKAIRVDDQLRYGVYEPEIPDGPYRPGLRPPPPDLPPLVRPPPPISNPPPPYGRPYPTPSLRPSLDPTNFEKCKCVHSFNCRSPALLFGSCDTGKKYCCEKSIVGEGNRGFRPDSVNPEILAGPGGPVDHLKYQNPSYTLDQLLWKSLLQLFTEPSRPGVGSNNGFYGRPIDNFSGIGTLTRHRDGTYGLAGNNRGSY